MTLADLDFADRVRAAAGWNQTRADWRRFLEFEPDGCFVAEFQGQAAGTATTITYGSDLGWIGMVLVDPDFRRKGIATELMEAALGYLSGRVRCIKLDATPDGAKVYERLGFRAEWELNRWVGQAVSESGSGRSEPISAMSDQSVFGANRESWLKLLANDAETVISNTQALGMIRRGVRSDYLGPITASNGEAGVELTRQLLDRFSRQTFWDIPEPNRAAIGLAEERGFSRVRPLLRMWAGEQLLVGQPELQFAIGDPATG